MPRERLVVNLGDLVADYESGISENQIAKRFGLTRGSVRLRLKEAGVHIRSQSESESLKWQQMSEDARKSQVAKANSAARGRKHSDAEKIQRAKTVMDRQLHTSPFETVLKAMLEARGVLATIQQAIGPYNCDLGADPVAVEVFGGGWHWSGRHMLRTPERFRYILNAGWHVLAIKISSVTHPLSAATADYVVAFIQEMRSDPTRRREYRVIGSAGDLFASGSADDDEISIIPTFTSGRNALGRYHRVPR